MKGADNLTAWLKVALREASGEAGIERSGAALFLARSVHCSTLWWMLVCASGFLLME